jgi:hypothetical protein
MNIATLNRANYCCKTVVSKQLRNLFQELETLSKGLLHVKHFRAVDV